MTIQHLPILAFTVCLAGTAAAQSLNFTTTQRGMMSTYPAGIVWSTNPSEITWKSSGSPASLTTFVGLGQGNQPEFTEAEIRRCLRAKMLANNKRQQIPPLTSLVFTGISTGNGRLPLVDVVPSTIAGQNEARVYQDPTSTTEWAALYLAVVPPSPGPAYGGADILGFYFGNPGFPATMQNRVYMEVEQAEYDPVLVAPNPVIDPAATIAGLDIGMGLIHADDGGDPAVHVRDRLYFSLSAASASTLLSELLAQPGQLTPTYLHRHGDGIPGFNGSGSGPLYDQQQPGFQHGFHGAMIFVAEFDGQTGECADVFVFVDHIDLQIAHTEQIDMLDVADARYVSSPIGESFDHGEKQVLFSVADTSSEEELNVLAVPGSGGGWKKLRARTQGGDKIVNGGAGTIEGSVVGGCDQDPEVMQLSGLIALPGHPVTPLPYGQASSQTLGLSLAKTAYPGLPQAPWPGCDGLFLDGLLSGWGTATPGNEACGMFLHYPDGTQTGDWLFVGLGMRTAVDDTLPFSVALNIPWVAQDHVYEFVVVTSSNNGTFHARMQRSQ